MTTIEKYKRLCADKLGLIDVLSTVGENKPRSFADLGGVWGVNGGYSFYALDRYEVDRAFLVDTDVTEATKKEAQRYPHLQVIVGNFGDERVIEQLEAVDVVLFFDVLLHQVNPDWDQILSRYASVSNCFVIANPQMTTAGRTVRLLDLGMEAYFALIPHTKNHPTYRSLLEKMHELHPQHNRPWRDVHHVWQWGITYRDLAKTMAQCGFTLKHFANFGPFHHLDRFENHGFIFEKA